MDIKEFIKLAKCCSSDQAGSCCEALGNKSGLRVTRYKNAACGAKRAKLCKRAGWIDRLFSNYNTAVEKAVAEQAKRRQEYKDVSHMGDVAGLLGGGTAGALLGGGLGAIIGGKEHWGKGMALGTGIGGVGGAAASIKLIRDAIGREYDDQRALDNWMQDQMNKKK